MLYEQNSLVIAGALLALILVANEIAYRAGRFVQRSADVELKTQTNSIQAAMLGLLALLLGFTFSMALQRYDSRTDAVIEEAMAIGTALLRAELLPSGHRQPTASLLRDYVALRVEASGIDLTRTVVRSELTQETRNLQQALWTEAARAVETDPQPVTTGLYVQALNDVFDAQGARNAILGKHVPEVVLFLLFGVFVTAGATLGYASGLGGRRPLLATILMNLLVVLVVFIIVDLDRPKRGLIQVDQSVLHELAAPP